MLLSSASLLDSLALYPTTTVFLGLINLSVKLVSGPQIPLIAARGNPCKLPVIVVSNISTG